MGTQSSLRLSRPGLSGKLEAPGHDADDDIGLPVKQDLCAENVRVAVEAAFPGGVTQHRDQLLLLIFLGGEDAAHERRDAQRGEDGGRHARGVDLGRLADSGELVARSSRNRRGSRKEWVSRG